MISRDRTTESHSAGNNDNIKKLIAFIVINHV